jgi:hypothetical protein
LLIVAGAVLAGVGLLGFGLVDSRSNGSAGPSVSPVALGADGIPTQIDSQRVYRISEQAEWQNLSGSFLLAAEPGIYFGTCPIPVAQAAVTPATSAETDLLGLGIPCYGAWLSNTTSSNTNDLTVAPKSPSLRTLFITWGGHAVVLRVHTHDPEAAECAAARRARCEAAVVVEALVWPTVPSEVNGEHVYSGTEVGGMEAAGTLTNLKAGFLLGGVVTVQAPGVMAAPCADYGPEAEQQLLATCHPQVWIDGALIAPDSNFDAVNGQIVIVRAHVNDALAAQCPADVRTACEEAIVVESVVWSFGPYSLATETPAVPSPTESATLGIESRQRVIGGPYAMAPAQPPRPLVTLAHTVQRWRSVASGRG